MKRNTLKSTVQLGAVFFICDTFGFSKGFDKHFGLLSKAATLCLTCKNLDGIMCPAKDRRRKKNMKNEIKIARITYTMLRGTEAKEKHIDMPIPEKRYKQLAEDLTPESSVWYEVRGALLKLTQLQGYEKLGEWSVELKIERRMINKYGATTTKTEGGVIIPCLKQKADGQRKRHTTAAGHPKAVVRTAGL